MIRFLLVALVVVMASFPARAGSNVSVGIGIWNAGGDHHHHRRGHWAPSRYVYAPAWRPYHRPRAAFVYSAPIYVAPPPPRVVYYPVPAPVVTPAPVCRTYNGDATFDSSGRPFYGTACLQGDGRWHIVP